MGARPEARTPARPGRKRDGSTSTHSPASSPSPQASSRRHCRIPLSSLRHAYCAAAWLLRAPLFPASVYALRLGLLRPTALLHLRAPLTSTCASACLAAGVRAPRHRPLPPRPSDPCPTFHFAGRRTSAPTGIMYFCAPMTDCADMVTDSDSEEWRRGVPGSRELGRGGTLATRMRPGYLRAVPVLNVLENMRTLAVSGSPHSAFAPIASDASHSARTRSSPFSGMTAGSLILPCGPQGVPTLIRRG
ncbi:hypothetical protein DFH08DRAFT_970102 [Mycena albidolilacea]|uniref:Uncharacterized protein n=1 Tax=Mycena albidolilacea TaxID=1033008 RepID=A0AAD7EG98_9AGAR|nr:hypothetical protein DFH08DRAFT_970102 [Mycena albidolilacea]